MEGSLLNKLTKFIWAMFKLNLLFAISNIVLIIAIVVLPFHLYTFPAYIIGAFLLIASLLALMQTLKRYSDSERSSLMRLYIRCYKEEFLDSLLFSLWYILGALFLIGAFFALQFSDNQILFIPLYFIFGIILYVHFVYALLIRVNYIITIKSTWKLGLYCISKHSLCALFIFGGSMILGALMYYFPTLIFLGVFPVAAYILTAGTKKIFENISIKLNLNMEEKLNESENDSKQDL